MNNTPLVSVCIFAYNHENYIKEALEGAISQTYENIEIIVSDDNSTDKTFDKIKTFCETYKGKHKITINKNKENLGIIRHFNKLIFELAHGEYVFLCAGDDISLPNRVSDSMELILDKKCHCVTMNMEYIDSTSKSRQHFFYPDLDSTYGYSLDDYINGTYKQVPGASRVISRDLMSFFGPLSDDAQTEDTPLNLRALLYGGIFVSHKCGVKYRIHSSNASSFKNLMRRFDPIVIFNQYMRDLDKAYSESIITNEQYYSIKKILNDNCTSEVLKRCLYNEGNILKKIVLLIKCLKACKDSKMYIVKIFIKSIVK